MNRNFNNLIDEITENHSNEEVYENDLDENISSSSSSSSSSTAGSTSSSNLRVYSSKFSATSEMDDDELAFFDGELSESMRKLHIESEKTYHNANINHKSESREYNEKLKYRKTKRSRNTNNHHFFDKNDSLFSDKKGLNELKELNKRYKISFSECKTPTLSPNVIIINNPTVLKDQVLIKLDKQKKTLSTDEYRKKASPYIYKDPSDFETLSSMDCFSLFSSKWISVMVNDPFLEAVFIYLNSIQNSGFFGIKGDYLRNIYFLESLGMRIEIITDDNSIIESSNILNDKYQNDSIVLKNIKNKLVGVKIARFRAFFQTKIHKSIEKSLSDIPDDEKKSSSSEKGESDSGIAYGMFSKTNQVISSKKIGQIDESTLSSNISLSEAFSILKSEKNNALLEKINFKNKNLSEMEKRKLEEERKEFINTNLIISKYESTTNQNPLYLGIDNEGYVREKFTGKTIIQKKLADKKSREEILRYEENEIGEYISSINEESTNEALGIFYDGRKVKKINKIEKKNDESSENEEDILVNHLYSKTILDNYSNHRDKENETESMNRDKIKKRFTKDIGKSIAKLKTLSRECSMDIKNQNPDSSTSNSSEISSWLEENLCVDIYVTPGDINLQDVNRKLDFVFSLCGLPPEKNLLAVENKIKKKPIN